MGRRFCTTHSAPNILRNGCFETGDADFFNVSGPSYSIIKTDTTNSPEGCLNYLRVIVSTATDPIVIHQSLLSQLGEYVDLRSGQERFDARLGIPEMNHGLVYTDFSSALSIRVIGGKVKISGEAIVRVLAGGVPDATITHSFGGTLVENEWTRITFNFDAVGTADPPTHLVHSIGFKIEFVSGSPEIHIGKMSAIEGLYTTLAYSGCMFSQAFPKGAGVLSLGRIAPPGFQVFSLDKSFFIKGGTPGEEGGSKHHEHNVRQEMADHTDSSINDEWYKRAFLVDKNILGTGSVASIDIDDSDQVYIDDGTVSHQHDSISPSSAVSDNTTPLWRGLTLCIKK